MLSISGKIPAAGGKNIERDSSIEFSIIDDGEGIDISTLIIEINGVRAYADEEFKSGYDGAASEVTPDGNNYSVIIDPEADFGVGKVIGIKVQVKNLIEEYLNESWAFKTPPLSPQLIDASPSNGEVLKQPQMIVLEFEDIIDGIELTSIDLSINGLSYILSGELVSEQNGPLSAISLTGNSVLIRIDPIEPLREGEYDIIYSLSDLSANFSNGLLGFIIKGTIPLPSDIKQIGFTGFFQGINKASDLGTGDSVLLEWSKPLVRSHSYESFSLIYANESRLETFDGDPSYIAASGTLSGTLTGLQTGETISYGVRALEGKKGAWDLTGMIEIDDGLLIIPDRVKVVSTVSNTDLRVEVESTDGWPSAGLLKIGNEVMRYESVLSESETFLIASNGRGLLGTTAGVYVADDEVSLFFGCQDDNTVIVMSTPTYHDGYRSGREINSTGILVTDFSDNDRKVFQGYDFCGYHHPLPQNVLQDKSCGSYLGGEHNGFRGMNLYDRMLSREEVLLDQTGEPLVLLRRVWDGEKCSCSTTRRDHPKLKSCANCFGTTYDGGYLQFINRRRQDRRIMVKFNEAQEDLKHGDHEQLQQEFEPTAWTLPIPAVKDRDILVRFDFTNDIEYIYEVLHTSREKILYRHFGRQNMALKRMDKTDILYTLIKSAIIDNTLLPTIK